MEKRKLKDQLGYDVIIENYLPKRIVSLVPSQTELLFDLGLDEEVVGITHFCVNPEDKFKEKQKIGGTKNVKIDKVKELEPDLIIANKEENKKEQIDELKQYYPVWVSDVYDLNSALEMITSVGELVGKAEESRKLADKIKVGFEDIPRSSSTKVLYFIWRKPYMAVGGDTFIHYMLEKAGFDNLLKDQNRYPELSTEEIKKLNPELIFLSSEPYPFKERHIEELRGIAPNATIRLVDGSMFSWYGSRMLKAVRYIEDLVAS